MSLEELLIVVTIVSSIVSIIVGISTLFTNWNIKYRLANFFNSIKRQKPQIADKQSEIPIHFSKHINLAQNIEYSLPQSLKRQNISVLKFTPDGKLLIAGLARDKIAIWDVATSEARQVPSKDQLAASNWDTYSIAVSSDGKWLAVSTYERKIQIWELKRVKEDRLINTNHAAKALAFSPDSNWLIAGSRDNGNISSWATYEDFRSVDNISNGEKGITVLKFHPNELKFVSGSIDGSIVYWEIVEEEIKKILTFTGHDEKHVTAIAFSPDGSFLVSGSTGGEIYLWDVVTGNMINQWKENNEVIRSLVFLPNSSFIVSSSNDKTLKIWDIKDGKLLSKKFERPVKSIDLSPDGKSLALCIEKGKKIDLWSIQEDSASNEQ